MRYFIFAIFAIGCAVSVTEGPRAVEAAAPGQAEGAVITRIVGRNQTIVVRAGAEGPRYSVESNNGQTVVPGMTLGELATKKPGLSRAVQTMQADVDTGVVAGSD